MMPADTAVAFPSSWLSWRAGPILLTWPSQQRCFLLSMVNMLLMSARSTTSDLGCFVLALDVQNTVHVSQMKAVEFLLMAHVGGPCLMRKDSDVVPLKQIVLCMLS